MMQPLYMTNPQDTYKRQGVLTASPIELIVMLYDGLKKNLLLGKKFLAKNDIEGTHKHLIRAQEIVAELVNSLDLSVPISKELLALYDFMLREIEEANVKKDTSKLDPVIEMVETLRSAWQEVSAGQKGVLSLKED